MRGECLCGAVRFEISGTPPKIYQCHCSLCRKQGGSASNTGMIVEAANFRWRSGEQGIGKYARPTGFRAHFCKTCGSTVPNPLRDTGFVWVPVGLIDDADGLEVVAQIYMGSRASWDQGKGPGQEHETMPEMHAFIRMLHGGGP